MSNLVPTNAFFAPIMHFLCKRKMQLNMHFAANIAKFCHPGHVLARACPPRRGLRGRGLLFLPAGRAHARGGSHRVGFYFFRFSRPFVRDSASRQHSRRHVRWDGIEVGSLVRQSVRSVATVPSQRNHTTPRQSRPPRRADPHCSVGPAWPCGALPAPF